MVLYNDGGLRIALKEQPPELRLSGQADVSHRYAIAEALRRIEHGIGPVLVDLSGLQFIDVGGARQLIDHAGLLGMDRREVRIVGVSPRVRRILRLCLWPAPPNLFVEGMSAPDPIDRQANRNGAGETPAASG